MPPTAIDSPVSRRKALRGLALTSVALSVRVAVGATPPRPADAPKAVLVELFTSQGCDLCPTAEKLIGSLPSMGFGPDAVIPVAFHVDYFDKPWKDPFSSPRHSRRQWEYSRLFNSAHNTNKPDYLYFTPLVMVDGRTPLLGSDKDGPAKLRGMIDEAQKTQVGVSLDLAWKPGDGERSKTLRIGVGATSASTAGREVLIGVAAVEDSIATEVASGELAGKTYEGHHVARSLAVETARPSRRGASNVEFPITLGDGWNPARISLVVFAQHESTGFILQAARLAWDAPAVVSP